MLYGRGQWCPNGARTVRLTINERIKGVVAGKDISNAAWDARLRVYDPSAPTSLILDLSMTKLVTTSTAGDGGEVSVVATIRTTYQDLRFQPVLVDRNTADTTTPSGYREYFIAPWEADCIQAATGAAA